jgi:hypothetical protein
MIAKIPLPEYWVKGGLLEKRIVSTDIWQVSDESTLAYADRITSIALILSTLFSRRCRTSR